MKKRVDFELTKKWGMYEKGHVFKNMKPAFARSLQDVRKVGKITGPSKAVAPGNDKADPNAKKKETK